MKEFIEKLIKRLEELKELHAELIKDGLEEDYHSGCEGMCVDIIEIVNQLAEEYKVSEMPTGWISVSERLPKKKTWVLVTRKSGVVDIEMLSTKGWISKIDEVIAWMPLPAPYTEGE